MLAESEMKVSVAKKAPKKGMQLGKPKAKKNALIQEMKKEKVIESNQEASQDPVAEEEQKTEGLKW